MANGQTLPPPLVARRPSPRTPPPPHHDLICSRSRCSFLISFFSSPSSFSRWLLLSQSCTFEFGVWGGGARVAECCLCSLAYGACWGCRRASFEGAERADRRARKSCVRAQHRPPRTRHPCMQTRTHPPGPAAGFARWVGAKQARLRAHARMHARACVQVRACMHACTRVHMLMRTSTQTHQAQGLRVRGGSAPAHAHVPACTHACVHSPRCGPHSPGPTAPRTPPAPPGPSSASGLSPTAACARLPCCGATCFTTPPQAPPAPLCYGVLLSQGGGLESCHPYFIRFASTALSPI